MISGHHETGKAMVTNAAANDKYTAIISKSSTTPSKR